MAWLTGGTRLMRLETERLVLRPLALGDLDALAEFYADPEVMRYLGGGGPVERLAVPREPGAHDRGLRGRRLRPACGRAEGGRGLPGPLRLLVWDTATWTPTRVLDAKGPVEIEVGWLLGSGYGGHGYATEAAVAVRDWALNNLDLQRLISLIYAENMRSIAVARKLGMELDGETEIFGKRVSVYALGKRPAR